MAGQKSLRKLIIDSRRGLITVVPEPPSQWLLKAEAKHSLSPRPNNCSTGVLLQAVACTDEYATEKMALLILKGLLVCLRAVA
jgi:hypothetical protein